MKTSGDEHISIASANNFSVVTNFDGGNTGAYKFSIYSATLLAAVTYCHHDATAITTTTYNVTTDILTGDVLPLDTIVALNCHIATGLNFGYHAVMLQFFKGIRGASQTSTQVCPMLSFYVKPTLLWAAFTGEPVILFDIYHLTADNFNF